MGTDPTCFLQRMTDFGQKLTDSRSTNNNMLNDKSFATLCVCLSLQKIEGAQWLSGRVLDLRTRGREFEPHRCHCFVVLEQDTFILA